MCTSQCVNEMSVWRQVSEKFDNISNTVEPLITDTLINEHLQ
jgi:hypothetical protein